MSTFKHYLDEHEEAGTDAFNLFHRAINQSKKTEEEPPRHLGNHNGSDKDTAGTGKSEPILRP